MGRDYAWPGNVRELEQCVRSLMIRKGYRPVQPRVLPVREEIGEAIDRGSLAAGELLRHYCTLVYWLGSYQEAARRLALGRRTAKSRVDLKLLARLRGERR